MASVKRLIQKVGNEQAQASARGFLEDLFDDYYAHRYKVYRMNLIRGIVFGFGSVIGGTLMIAILLWALSYLNNIPFVGRFTQTVQHSIETSKQTNTEMRR